MKGILISVIFLLTLIGLSGCYTVPQHFADDNECDQVIIYYEVPLPPPPPPVYYPPAPDPRPTPIIRQPEEGNDSRNGSGNQVRDPLRGHGSRGNDERNTKGRQ